MKTLLYTLSFVLVSTWGVAQNAVNDYFNINQKARKYPGFGVANYQGLFSGGHPYVSMGNYGGNTANKSATPKNVILGSLIFNGHDGKNNIQIGRIETYSTETFSEKNYPVKMRFLVGGTATCCGKERMTIDGQTGNIGIGTTNPREKLSVNGKIRAKEVKVEIENWPDYVFKNDYKLLSLADVKKHIATKGHLPNIPSAKEISDQGAALGALNVKLLEKIEELTLYTLDQEAQLQQQQHTINTLMERLSQIESQLNQHEKPTP